MCPEDLSKCLPLGIGNYQSAGELFSKLTVPAFSIAGTAVFIYFVYAAIKWIMSGGDKEAIASARKMITHSIIALLLLVLLFLFVEFLPAALGTTYTIIGP